KNAAKRKVASLAFWSIIIAFVVLGLKLAAWYVTGSVALYSDALESIVNVIASAAAYWAIQVSHKPADQDHPFGHHKAEYFSAVLEGVLIVLAALLILNEV
ncbi:MAG: cation diffusion facilitator family transporter, partial [Mesorhizobium sp.]